MNMKFTIYGKDNCLWCKKAMERCDAEGFEYEYINVSTPQNLKRLKDLLPAVRTVPQVFLEDIYVGNHDEFIAFIEQKNEWINKQPLEPWNPDSDFGQGQL